MLPVMSHFCALESTARCDAVAAEFRAHTPAPTLAAAWSEVLRHGVGAAARLTSGADAPEWTWFVSGSGARGEAAPGSDVETMVALADGLDEAAKTDAAGPCGRGARAAGALRDPRDANGVLASRPGSADGGAAGPRASNGGRLTPGTTAAW